MWYIESSSTGDRTTEQQLYSPSSVPVYIAFGGGATLRVLAEQQWLLLPPKTSF